MIRQLAGHEWRRARRTGRVWLVLAFFLFQGVVEPVGARYLVAVLEAVTAGAIQAPETRMAPLEVMSAYGSDSTRLALLVFALAFMATAADEFKRDSGSGAFVFTRYRDPRPLLVAKTLVVSGVGWGAYLSGFAVAAVLTTVLFGAAPLGGVLLMPFVSALYWTTIAILLVSGGVIGRGQGWAILFTVPVALGFALAELIPVLRPWTPSLLLRAGERPPGEMIRPALTAIMLAAPAFFWAVRAARRAVD